YQLKTEMSNREFQFLLKLHRNFALCLDDEDDTRAETPLFGTTVASYRLDLVFGARGFQVRNPIPPKICRVWCLLHDKSYVVAKRPSTGVRNFGERGASSGVALVI
ncbi:hypothetical protein AVEN_40942-1, partial [Araneus ventricosus]